ncbi:MAG: TonB-dependent receptor [Desulfomonilaceae bacterium]
MRFQHIRFLNLFLILAVSTFIAAPRAIAQGTSTPQQLERVEVEPPERRVTSGGTSSGQGFGYDQPIPSGQAFSDFPVTRSQVVSPTGRVANMATVPSAITVIDNQGIAAQGRTGIGDMLQGQPGTWASGYNGNMFSAQIGIRGFSATPASLNRTALLLEGRNLEIPRSDADTGFLFPEIIERIELMRGDGTVQFGNKAIGGSVNILLKRPRQNPGSYFGAEASSWRGQRQWGGINLVRGSVAAGIFLGQYSEEGFRLYGGDGISQEFVPRPGPWDLTNCITSLNWKITPRLTLDVSNIWTQQRMVNSPFVTLEEFRRRDTREVRSWQGSSGSFAPAMDRVDCGPEERKDSVTSVQLLYDGGRFGTLSVIGSQRIYLDKNLTSMLAASSGPSFFKWTDFGLCTKYTRTDRYDFIRNDLTLGSDLYDGFFGQENKWANKATYATSGTFGHRGQTSFYRETIGYYVLDQLSFWDRVIIGLGHRTENYEYKDLYVNTQSTGAIAINTPSVRKGQTKSASFYAANLVYDKKLGSCLYYKHSRTYRFPTTSDLVTTGTFVFPVVTAKGVYNLVAEEGTIKESGIRHWFTPNIYASLIYYELDMDSEIMGSWTTDPVAGVVRVNANVPSVGHEGLEFEGMIRLTPRWTLDGNFTKQRVWYRTGAEASAIYTQPYGRKADAWVPVNPYQMYNCTLSYNNTDWGFSAAFTYHYFGKRYFQGDDTNSAQDLDEIKLGDLAVSQTFFDGLATVYFGIKNINDLQYAYNCFWDASSSNPKTPPVEPEILRYELWPNAGRTYYGGVKLALDYDRMRLPTSADMQRMQQRLYGAVGEGLDSVSFAGGWLRGRLPF